MTGAVPQPNYQDLADNPETRHLFLTELNNAIENNRVAAEATIASLEARVEILEQPGVTPTASPKVWYAQKTDTQELTTGPWADVTGLSLSITLDEQVDLLISAHVTVNADAQNSNISMRVVRDGSVIVEGDADGSRLQTITGTGPVNSGVLYNASLCILDENIAAGTYTYQFQMRTNNPSLFVNRSETDTDAATFYRGVSTLHAIAIDKQ